MVVCSGGMSVDPDDRTPGAIKATGTRIVSYGAPVLPGAMMLVSYYEKDGRQKMCIRDRFSTTSTASRNRWSVLSTSQTARH